MGTAGSAGAGPPSISATETSTNQALEMVEQRKDAQTVSTEEAPADDGAAAEPEPQQAAPKPQQAQPSQGSGGSSAPKPAAAAKKKPKPVYADDAPAPVKKKAKPVYADAPSSPPAVAYSAFRTGVWTQVYGDREKNSDVDIGVSTLGGISVDPKDTIVKREQESAGVIAGVDWTYIAPGANLKGMMLGVFGGYNKTHSDFSDGRFVAPDLNLPAGNFGIYNRTNAEETIEGGFAGAYAALFLGKLTADVAFKADFFEFSHDETIQQIITCNTDPAMDRAGVVDQNDYIVAANASYRIDLSSSQWLEPTFGVRYTYVDFGTSRGDLEIGEEDGEVFRIQGGYRMGHSWTTPAGNPAAITFTSLLYSDVSIDGFVGPNSGVVLTDEGKIRGLSRVNTSIGLGDGLSFIGELEARTGEDYYGYGGRAGLRYEW